MLQPFLFAWLTYLPDLAVIFVTHDFPEAQTLADRVAILAGGEFCRAFQADELYTAPWPEAARRLLGVEPG